ncbi:creatininase family protein [Accumulibacter sp.]|uniref:creatininase family protein n=1 Tax=Accumulibacter sp. TaxID=2053492 RepID=UPI001ACBD617|nr:creatininase family protein [Accumulibacter sp.]MBN8451485.1 creatininase family protein [Accumulibacter sp.]
MAERTTKSLGFPSFCMGDLSYVDIQQYLKHSDTILIPKASLEQHGPHLPLYCDTITATEVAQRAGEEAGILYTPTIWMGYSPQHMREPGWGAGTITLRADTYLNMIYDVGRSLIHHGFNRLIFVNGHGSNVKVIDPVLRKLRNETGALIAYYKPYAERYIGMLKDVLEGPVEETPGWHAGELETSQCLAHNPDLVRLDRAQADKAHAPKWLGEQGWRRCGHLAGFHRRHPPGVSHGAAARRQFPRRNGSFRQERAARGSPRSRGLSCHPRRRPAPAQSGLHPSCPA